jgi:hypothetical protein
VRGHARTGAWCGIRDEPPAVGRDSAKQRLRHREKKVDPVTVKLAFDGRTDLKGNPASLQFSPAKPPFNGVTGWPDLLLV